MNKRSGSVADQRNGNGRRDTDDLAVTVAVIATSVAHIEDGMGKLVTKDEFNPVRNVVYGMVVLILVAVMGGLMALVVLA